MAFISIILGFINLLPVPMFDGGHLLFYAIEAVRRRPVKAKAQELAFLSGLALLVSLMLLVTLNDLSTLGLWEKLANLAGRSEEHTSELQSLMRISYAVFCLKKKKQKKNKNTRQSIEKHMTQQS